MSVTLEGRDGRHTTKAVIYLLAACMLSHSIMSHSATPWTAAHQAPLPMEFSRQEYWSGLPFPPPRDLSNPGIEHASLASPTLADRFFLTESSGKSTF